MADPRETRFASRDAHARTVQRRDGRAPLYLDVSGPTPYKVTPRANIPPFAAKPLSRIPTFNYFCIDF